jgi:hypothetical protein
MRYITHNRNSTVFVAERYFLITFSRDDIVLAGHRATAAFKQLTGDPTGSTEHPSSLSTARERIRVAAREVRIRPAVLAEINGRGHG